MKMDPCDTVKLRASLVTWWDTEMYSGTHITGERGEIGGGDRGEEGERARNGGREETRERPLRVRENWM